MEEGQGAKMTEDELYQQYLYEKYQEEQKNPYGVGREDRSVPPQEEGSTFREFYNAAQSGFGQGLTWGGMDEAVGAIESPIRMLTGKQGLPSAYSEGKSKSLEKYKEGQKTNPFTSGAGEIAGSLLSGYGLWKLLKPETFLGSATLGGAEGLGISAGKAENIDEFLKMAPASTAFGVAGAGGGFALNDLFRRINRIKTLDESPRHKQAEDLGIKLTPGQKFDDPDLLRLEAGLESKVGWGDPFDELKANNQEVANKVAARTIGSDANKLTEVEYGKATDKIKDLFKKSDESGDIIELDYEWEDEIEAINDAYSKVWGKGQDPLPAVTDAIDALDKGFLSPRDFQRQYSALGKQMETAYKNGDGVLAGTYRKMRESLGRLLDRQSEDVSATLKEARRLYKNQLLLEQPGVLRTETGDVSPLRLANKLASTDKPGYMRGKNTSDLYNLARVTKAFDAGIGNSGTATRQGGLYDHLKAPVTSRLGNWYMQGNKGGTLSAPVPKDYISGGWPNIAAPAEILTLRDYLLTEE